MNSLQQAEPLSLSLRDTWKKEGMGDMCCSTAGHGGGGKDRMPRDRMDVMATKRGKWVHP